MRLVRSNSLHYKCVICIESTKHILKAKPTKPYTTLVLVFTEYFTFYINSCDYLIKLCFSYFIDTLHKDFWKTNPLTETHYQINANSLLTWHQARRSCQQQNAELLSVTNPHEEMFLLGKAKNYIQTSKWMYIKWALKWILTFTVWK